MTTTNSVLKTLQNREVFNRHFDKVKKDFFTEEQWNICKAYRRLFESDIDVRNLDADDIFYILKSEIVTDAKDQDLDNYRLILSNIKNSEVCLPNVLVEHCFAESYRELLSKVSSLPPHRILKSHEKLVNFISDWKFHQQIEEIDHIVKFDLDSILDKTGRKEGLMWPEPFTSFNQMLGPLIAGDFGIVAGATNIGKSLIGLWLCNAFASQIPDGAQIRFYTGEGQPERYYLASIRMALNKSEKWIRDNKTKALDMYYEKMGGENKIIVCNALDLDLNEVNKDLCDNDIRFVVYDQLDHLRLGKNRVGDGKPQMARIYNTARNLSKTYCPAIAVSQLSMGKCQKTWFDNEGNQHQKWLQNIPYTCMEGDTSVKGNSCEFMFTMNYTNKADSTLRNGFIAKNKLNGVFDKVQYDFKLDPDNLQLGKV